MSKTLEMRSDTITMENEIGELQAEVSRLTEELAREKHIIKCDAMSCRYVGEAERLVREMVKVTEERNLAIKAVGSTERELEKSRKQIKRCQECPEVEHNCDECQYIKEARK